MQIGNSRAAQTRQSEFLILDQLTPFINYVAHTAHFRTEAKSLSTCSGIDEWL